MFSNKETDISHHFSIPQLLAYTFPGVVMVFTVAIYQIIDGFFISNYTGEDSFAAVNTVFPMMYILASFGLMIGNGGSAIIGNLLGQKNTEQANKTFSLLVYFCFAGGVLLSIVGYFLCEPLCLAMGAEDEVLADAIYYGRVSMISLSMYTMMMAFSIFFSTAGKPIMGFIISVISAVVIIVLDTILVGIFKMGINGILIATIVTEFIGAILPIVYFGHKNPSLLRLVSPKKAFSSDNKNKLHTICRACINGSSSMVTETAMSIVVIITIYQLNRYVGEEGVVAYGVIEYAWLIFSSFYLGFSSSAAPLMSYQQGANNKKEMRSLFMKSYNIIFVASIINAAISFFAARQIAMIFTSYDESLIDITVHALSIYSLAFLFSGTSTYGISLFASLGEGVIGAGISLSRTLFFEIVFLIVFPIYFGGDGIWWAISVAEISSAVMCLTIVALKGPKLGILKYNKKLSV